jgi:hypothetical protein
VCGVDPVLAEISQRAVETIKAFLAVAALDAPVVDVVAELDVRIESASRLWPAERDVAAEFCASHVAHEQHASVEPVRRKRAEVVAPLTNDPARSHFKRNEAERR